MRMLRSKNLNTTSVNSKLRMLTFLSATYWSDCLRQLWLFIGCFERLAGLVELRSQTLGLEKNQIVFLYSYLNIAYTMHK